MAEAELKERKFGYVVQPPSCPHHHPVPPFPPPPFLIPPGMTVADWTNYINSYVDVRARQLYEKLKKIIPEGGGSSGGVNNYILLRDVSKPNDVYEVYIQDGNLQSQLHVGSNSQQSSNDTEQLQDDEDGTGEPVDEHNP